MAATGHKQALDKRKQHGWVGFDLDGTLAYYDSKDFDPQSIGDPIEGMVAIAKQHLEQGDECYIVTGRVTHPDDSPRDKDAIKQLIRDWTREHLGEALECRDKDYQMRVLYDDRCRQVITNVGVTMGQIVKALRLALEHSEDGLEELLEPEVEDALVNLPEEKEGADGESRGGA